MKKTNYKSVETLTDILKGCAIMIDRARNKENNCLFDYPDAVLSDIYACINHVLTEANK